MKNQKGITLIALVITIIVLLILAGVSIAMLTDPNNGILTQATRAKDNTSKAEVADRINMALNGAYATILGEDKLQTEKEIEDENGLDSTNYEIVTYSKETGKKTIKDLEAEEAESTIVVKIESKVYTDITGKIVYTKADKKYAITKAEYPQKSTNQ